MRLHVSHHDKRTFENKRNPGNQNREPCISGKLTWDMSKNAQSSSWSVWKIPHFENSASKTTTVLRQVRIRRWLCAQRYSCVKRCYAWLSHFTLQNMKSTDLLISRSLVPKDKRRRKRFKIYLVQLQQARSDDRHLQTLPAHRLFNRLLQDDDEPRLPCPQVGGMG